VSRLLILVVALAALTIARAQAASRLPPGLVRVISKATPETMGAVIPMELEQLPEKEGAGKYLAELRRWFESPRPGTGLVFDAKGYVLVSGQLLKNHRKLEVEVAPGSWFPGRLVGLDSMTDLAVVKVAVHLPEGKLAEYYPEIGERISIAGYPAGRPGLRFGKVVDPEVRRVSTDLERFISTDLKHQAGYAGGVLVNQRQEAIAWVLGPDAIPPPSPGMVKRGYRESLPVFALDGLRVRQIAREIITRGKFSRPYLGMRVIELKTGKGLKVLRVIGDSPADRAGVRGGDVLLQMGGKSIPNEAWLRRQVLTRKQGDRMVFAVERQGETLDITVNLSIFGREDELRLQ